MSQRKKKEAIGNTTCSNCGQLMRPTDLRMNIIPLGNYVKGYGKVEMIGLTGGERYYWLNNDGVVVMIPAFMIEQDYWSGKLS